MEGKTNTVEFRFYGLNKIFYCLLVFGLIFGLSGNISAASIECNSCADCTGKLNGNYDEVYLNTSIRNHSGTCVIFGASNVTFDCQRHTIDGDDQSHPNRVYGIYLNGKSGNMIKNCVITDFSDGIRLLDHSSNNKIINNN